MPRPLAGAQFLDAAVAAHQRKKDEQAEDAAQKDKLHKGVIGKQRFCANIQSQSARYSE